MLLVLDFSTSHVLMRCIVLAFLFNAKFVRHSMTPGYITDDVFRSIQEMYLK